MYSISTNTYTFEQKRNGKIPFNWNKFQRKDTSLGELAEYINHGHIFTHDFGLEHFTTKDKKDDNFSSACFISLDIDDCPIKMEDVVESLDKKPTMYYYTASNGFKGEGYRFRFIYVFDEPITKDCYKLLVWAVEHYIEKNVVGFKSTDNCHYSYSQQYAGANGNINVNFESTYRTKDFPIDKVAFAFDSVKKTNFNSSSKKYVMPDTQFFKDLQELNEYEFLIQYNSMRTRDMSFPIEIDEERGIEYFGDDFIQINRPWCIKVADNGKMRRIINEIQDGENRRRRLFAMGCVYRKITKDMTIENLIVDLVFERMTCFSNFDGKLDNKEIFDIASRIMDMDYDSIKVGNQRKKKKFRIYDKTYCHRNYIKPQSLSCTILKEMRYKKLIDIYDFSKSKSENIRILRTLEIKDIPKSKSSIDNFLKWIDENNILKEKREGQYYTNHPFQKVRKNWSDEELGNVVDVSKSVRENIEECEKLGMLVTDYRMRKFYKDNHIPLTQIHKPHTKRKK